MSNRLQSVGLLFAFFMATVTLMATEQRAPTPPATTAADEAQIRKILENHVVWTNARDWQSIRTEFADDVVIMSNFTPTLVGKEEVSQLFRENFEQQTAAGLTVRMEAALDEVRVLGDWAFDRGIFVITATAKDGEQKQYHLRFLEIFRREPDGSWKIVRGMNNSLPPPVGRREPSRGSLGPAGSGSMPTPEQIVERYSEAIGGRTAFEKLTSRVAVGSVELPFQGLSGRVEIYAKAPNKSLMAMNFSGVGLIRQGFNGTVGWAENPQTGVRTLSGGELAARRLDAEFYREVRLNETYPQMRLLGKEKLGEAEAYVVEATPASGSSEFLYFDARSGLLLGRDAERESPQGRIHVETRFENYREVDGIRLPFAIRISNPFTTYRLTLEQVRHNVAIDDAKFDVPPAR